MYSKLKIHTGLLAAVLALAAPCALSQSSPANLRQALDAAWQRSPQARTLEARRAETAAGRDAARSWIAGSPTLGLAQRSDRWTERNGARETELSLSAPLWLPGQMTARQAQAQAGSADLEAQIAVARLTLAAQVRDALWAVAAATEALDAAGRRRQNLEATAEEVTRRVKAGDLARSDGMLARQETLAAVGAELDARARLQQALNQYAMLTGLSEMPVAEPEAPAPAMQEPHPRLLAARASLQHARAAFELVNKTRSEPPTVGVAIRRERDEAGSRPASSIGFALEIPIGTAARNRPLESAARTQVESAAAELAQVEASLQADVALARQQLSAAQQSLQAATERAALAREHAALIEKAFRLGERGLNDLLRAQSLLHEAEAGERQQRIAIGAATARLNQALGVTP